VCVVSFLESKTTFWEGGIIVREKAQHLRTWIFIYSGLEKYIKEPKGCLAINLLPHSKNVEMLCVYTCIYKRDINTRLM
jgi:hypothetical protein